MTDDSTTNALMLEILKDLQNGQKDMRESLYGIREEIRALRNHMAGFQTDIGNLYASQTTMNKELERVQLRLGLNEPEH